MAIHLTPTELGREAGMHRREVISRCMEMGVPIFQGRIDKTLFISSLKDAQQKRGAREGVARPESPRIPAVADSEGEHMEAVTAGATGAQGTGSKTIADLLPLAVKKYGQKPAQRYKVGRRVGRPLLRASSARRSREVALGLVDLGIQPGDKVSILAHTRPEWTDACFGILTAGGDARHDLPDELARGVPVRARPLRLARDLRRGRRSSSPRSARSQDQCPELEHVIVMDPGDAELRRRALARRSCASAAAAVTSPSGRRATTPSRRTTSASTSTRPAPPARRRAACSRTRTTARSPTPSWTRARWRRAIPPTSSCRSRTPSRS